MFGDVRSLLQEAPSPFVWDALTWLVEQVDAQELQAQLLPYLEHHLARWPASLKVLPTSWKLALSRQESPQGMPLVQELHLSSQHGASTLDSAGRWRVLDHEATAHIERLNFHYAELTDADLDRLTAHPRLRRARALNLTSNTGLSEAALVRLLQGADFMQLEELRLGSCPALTSAAINALLSASWAAKLQELDVQSTRQSHEAITALLQAAVRHQWRSLDVSNNGNASAHLEVLFSQGPIALSSLGLASCGLTDAQVAALCSRKELAELQSLELSRNKLSALSFEAIGLATHLRLKELKMSGNSYLVKDPYTSPKGFERSYECFERFCQASHLSELRYLKLRGCDLDEAAMSRLGQASFLQSLEELNLSNNPLGHTGLGPLLAGAPKKLRALNLSQCHLRASSLHMLTRCEALSQLESLDLSANPLQRIGLRALAEQHRLTNLKSLNLSSTQPDPGALVNILNSPIMSTVQELGLSHITITDPVIVALAQSPYCGNLQVVRWMPQTLMSRTSRKHIERSTTLHPRLIQSLIDQSKA